MLEAIKEEHRKVLTQLASNVDILHAENRKVYESTKLVIDKVYTGTVKTVGEMTYHFVRVIKRAYKKGSDANTAQGMGGNVHQKWLCILVVCLSGNYNKN
jgi:hypothetical protein